MLWLEDKSGNKVSSTYISDIRLLKNKITYGNVVVQYKSEEDTDKMFLNFRSLDGYDDVYVCDSNTNIINESSMFSLRTTSGEIPQNSFVKIAVNDGVVSAIQIEPEYMDICTADFDYTDELNGKAYILNNTQEMEEFICYIAAYNNLDVMKCCNIVPVTLESGDFISVTPEFVDYEYSQDDYLKIFALADKNLIPLSKVAVADVVGK